ncbi:hypothetical protein GCM10007079_17940 [Nocardiopsis terrae]|nr:hypothetical protein GCM10007079_17940 [Nocardiopsis terrae]
MEPFVDPSRGSLCALITGDPCPSDRRVMRVRTRSRSRAVPYPVQAPVPPPPRLAPGPRARTFTGEKPLVHLLSIWSPPKRHGYVLFRTHPRWERWSGNG